VSERVDYLEKLAREQGKFVRRDGDKLVVSGKVVLPAVPLSELKHAHEMIRDQPMDWDGIDAAPHADSEGDEE
jgi:hypothetical protein